MSSIISKAEFARLAGVSPAAISKATRGRLRPALCEGGINAEHPAAAAYLSRARRVARPGRVKGDDLADFIVEHAKQLGHIRLSLPARYDQLAQNVADNLFYLGFAEKWMPAGERAIRIDFVRKSLERLQAVEDGRNRPTDSLHPLGY